VRWLEWLASLLILVGVWLIAYGIPEMIVVAWVGVVPLTLGVRLAIDCGKAG
jgi:hypothetical protein